MKIFLTDFHFIIKEFNIKQYHYFHKTTQDEWRSTLGSFLFFNLSQIWRKNRQSSFMSEMFIYTQAVKGRMGAAE